MFFIGWRQSPSDEYFTGYKVLPEDSWNCQTQWFMSSQESGPVGAIVDYHKHTSNTSTMTIFGLGANREPWVVSLSETGWPGDWMAYMPSGKETQSSDVVLSQSTSSEDVYKSRIGRAPNSDQIFTIDIWIERH